MNALRLVMVSALVIAGAYGSAFLPGGPPAWAPWAFMVAATAILIGMAALGAARPGRTPGKLYIALILTFIIVAGSFALALALPATDISVPQLVLGLPRRAAAILYGIGLLPAFILPVAYALTFDTMTLSDDDWARVRKAGEEYRAAKEAS